PDSNTFIKMNSKELFKSWNDCIEQEKKHWMRHTSDKQYIKGRILKGFDSFKTSNKLPSPNYDQTCISEIIINIRYYNVTVEEIHQKIQSIDKNKDKYEHPPIISDKLRELVGIPVQKFKKDLSKQYEEIKNDFKSIQESYVELKNQLDANNKFMIYRLKENNEYLIEKLTNKT
ncbi:14105_t:CDS:2, partial [Entrophospora sp. SA101]